jgi:hypothetical protein
VVSSVVSLANELKAVPLTEDEIVILGGQTKQVLLAQDPVLQLLNDRMRCIFRELAGASIRERNTNDAISNTQMPPATIISNHSNKNNTSSAFVKKAKAIFCARGLGFYATDLARAAELATSVPELASYLWDGEIQAIISAKC